MRIVQAWLVCVLALMLCVDSRRAGAQSADEPDDDRPVVDAFLSNASPPPTSYRALRTLEAVTRGGRMRATLKAWTSTSPETGFQYSIVEESGAAIIRNKVLRAALDAEHTISRQSPDDRGALTAANYDFVFAGEEDGGLIRINIHPKRKEKMLVDGSVLVTAADADLVQVEGTLVKRPSFWTRHVDVVRQYARLTGVRVPIAMKSTADVLIAGTSTFEMSYEYDMINGKAIDSAQFGDPTTPEPPHRVSIDY